MAVNKLILTQEVSGLGSPGDVVEVKGGYARNYLIPTGRAVAWTRGGQKQVESIRGARRARAVADDEQARAVKARLESQPVRVEVRTGGSGRLFGSVSPADVAAAVGRAGLGDVDRRTIELATPIRATGTHRATVRVHDDVVAELTLEVVAGA